MQNAQTQNAKTNNKSPFDPTQRVVADSSSSFDMATAADVSLKVLVAAAAGTIIYKQFAGDKTDK